MNIKQIQSFVAVADTKSFSEAAQSMYISVSQISKMIKGLEDELGQVLFERKKSGVLLTREGAKLYNIANKVLRDIDEFELIKERNGKESLVILGLPDVYLDDIFLNHIKQKKENDYFYNLSNRSIDNVCQALHVRKADMGFAYVEERRKTAINMRLSEYALDFTPIAKTRKYMSVNSKHRLASLRRVEISDVEKTDQVKINGTDFLKAEYIKNSYGNMFSRPNVKMLTYSLHTAMNIVKNTDMIYIGCDIFNELSEVEKVTRVPFAEGYTDVEFGYIKRHTVDLSYMAKEFLSCVKNRIDG